MTIDLSQYVDKTITAQLGDDSFLTGQVSLNDSYGYPYAICGYWFSKYGAGYSRANIVRIFSLEHTFNGIAQKAPNIDLDNFIGQKVYVKLARGSEHITNVTSTYNLSEVGQYKKTEHPHLVMNIGLL